MEAIKISLDDYVLSGGGANGESFDHKTDPSVMLKLYFPGKIQQPLDEMNLARKVYELGIPTPEPGEYVVTEDGRYGIRFRRILGKKSYSRATADNPEKVSEYASEFARMCKQLHATHIDPAGFENVKDRYYRLLDEDTAIHGDLQFSNAIFVGEKRYFIDLGDFCYGNHLFDLGMVYLCSNLSPEPFILETFHMPKSLAIEFWRKFVPAYFGEDRPLCEVEEMIRPYAGLKTLIIERDMNQPMPVFRDALKTVL